LDLKKRLNLKLYKLCLVKDGGSPKIAVDGIRSTFRIDDLEEAGWRLSSRKKTSSGSNQGPNVGNVTGKSKLSSYAIQENLCTFILIARGARKVDRTLTNPLGRYVKITANEVIMARHLGRGSSRPTSQGREFPSALPWTQRALMLSEEQASAVSFSLFAFLILIIVVGMAPSAGAQSPVDDVHVSPRIQPPPSPEKQIVDPALRTHTKPLQTNVDLVLVPVTITDPMNRLVTGLDKENFAVYEGKDQQEIKHFSSEDAPVSLGVIFDMSGSMSSKIERAREAVIEFFKTANPQDEFFMITFADKPEEISDFTQSIEDIQGKLVYTVPKGRTALLDAIYLGVSKMRQAKYPKKSLLVISDGGDNHSRYTEGEIKSVVKEADLLIYAIGIYDRYMSTPEEQLGPALLSDLTELTGGRAFTIDNPNDLADVATKIGIELRNQYVLGYRPKNSAHDGKWRKIKVKLVPPKGLPPLRVYAKTGYYAPTE
jgi:Ca-activated chloride channel family protein